MPPKLRNINTSQFISTPPPSKIETAEEEGNQTSPEQQLDVEVLEKIVEPAE